MQFTIPLATGNYPFKLTETDKARSADNWAWSFLRLNPLYRYDFNLIQGRKKLSPHLEEARKLVSLARMHAQPLNGTSFSTSGPVPDLPKKPPKAVGELDSRYFFHEGKPLHRPLDGFQVIPATLQEWLHEHGGIESLARLQIRDFDAARDYGIADWINPKEKTLEELQPGQSWFYFVNEPVWTAGTWALQPSTKLLKHKCTSGREIAVGTESRTVVVTEVIEKHAPDFQTEIVKQVVHKRPIPFLQGSTRSTELHFLICLDGYIEPQLQAIQLVAEDLKALHKEFYPKAVARGSLPDFVPVVKNSSAFTAYKDGIWIALLTSVRQAPTRSRKNWVGITIDVAAPMVQQFTHLTEVLDRLQDELVDQLTFPLRKRAGGTTGDHWLKKDLCVLELYLYGLGEERLRPSILTMARAIYDKGDSMYSTLRQGSTDATLSKVPIEESPITPDHPKFEVIKEALANAMDVSLGWYEFVAWSGAHTKAQSAAKATKKET